MTFFFLVIGIIPKKHVGAPEVLTQSEFIRVCRIRSTWSCSIISPSSKLEIMHHLFCWIPYSLKNVLKKFKNFLSIGSTGWESA